MGTRVALSALAVMIVASWLAWAGSLSGEGDIPGLVGADGRAFAWQQWLDDNAPAAVLLFSTWAPGSADVLDRLDAITGACQERGLHLVVVDVQEEIEAARRVLGDRKVLWLHDRHGAALKRLRVIRVPALVVIGSDGEVAVRLEPTAEAVRAQELSS